MILEPRRQFLGFKTELHDPSKYSQSKSPAKQTVSDKPSYTRPIGKVKARAEPRQKASIVRLSSLIQATPSPDLSRSKNSSPTKSEKGSTIQSTPDMNGIKHQRHPTMGTSER